MSYSSPIKPVDTEKYAHLDLHELEIALKKLESAPPNKMRSQELNTIRHAIRKRLRTLKAHAIEFEQTNDQHLLVFDSTDGYAKIAGHSVLFYSMTIADRIHRRFCVKNDSDHYSHSEEGIIAIRHIEDLAEQLAAINIFPDPKLSTNELHFFKLSKIYSDEQINRLRDRSNQDLERINSIIVPRSPIPLLYDAIRRFNFMLYHNFKRTPDPFARAAIGDAMLREANELTVQYLNYASPRQNAPASCLAEILRLTRRLRHEMANVENLHLFHQREICQLLELIVEIDRLTSKVYRTRLQQEAEAPTTATISTTSTPVVQSIAANPLPHQPYTFPLQSLKAQRKRK